MLQSIKTAKTMSDDVDGISSEVSDVNSDSYPGASGLQERVRSRRFESVLFVRVKMGLNGDEGTWQDEVTR